jgi:hypothetical protein
LEKAQLLEAFTKSGAPSVLPIEKAILNLLKNSNMGISPCQEDGGELSNNMYVASYGAIDLNFGTKNPSFPDRS